MLYGSRDVPLAVREGNELFNVDPFPFHIRIQVRTVHGNTSLSFHFRLDCRLLDVIIIVNGR